LIEDNPLTVRALREMILRLGKREGMVFYIEDAHSIDSAQHIIENFSQSHSVNYIFLNLQTISSLGNSMVAKELLAQSIQQKYPSCKLVLSTPYSKPIPYQCTHKHHSLRRITYKKGPKIRQIPHYTAVSYLIPSLF